MNEEPSVLDFVKDKLAFWRPSRLNWPEAAEEPIDVSMEEEITQPVQAVAPPEPAPERPAGARLRDVPWQAFLLAGLLPAAQYFLEPPLRSWQTGVALYTLALVLIIVLWRGGRLPPVERLEDNREDTPRPGGEQLSSGWLMAASGIAVGLGLTLFWYFLRHGQPVSGLLILAGVLIGAGLLLAGLTSPLFAPITGRTDLREGWRLAALMAVFLLLVWFTFEKDRFTILNLLLWVLLMGSAWIAFTRLDPRQLFQDAFARLREPFTLRMTLFSLALAAVLVLTAVFRFLHLNALPGEMFSDHAEKLFDVMDVLAGSGSTFFPRNTGREFVQFYWTAAVSLVFGTGISFMSLKIGTALAGLITLIYIYRSGVELGGKWVALLALVFAAVGYWPNVISRIGLRFPFYALAAAPVIFHLLRGFHRRTAVDFAWAGIWLGIGLNGYTAGRILPLLVLCAFGLYWLHGKQSRGARRASLVWLAGLAYLAFLFCIPLLHYAAGNPEVVLYRSLTRVAETETAIQGSVWMVFFSNLGKALVMFFWNNGGVWVHSIPSRPALALIDAAFYFLGLVWAMLEYLRRRDWRLLFLLLAIPILLLPSVLSLAFPAENPSLNRTSAAYVPVFLLEALGVWALVRGICQQIPTARGRIAAAGLAGLIVLFSVAGNARLFFGQYAQQYTLNAWNTSQLGGVMRAFADFNGGYDGTWVVGYPYWVDTRLVGINAGSPLRNPETNLEHLPNTFSDPRAKLYLLNPQDGTALNLLLQQYPLGRYHLERNPLPGKDFIVFTVPAQEGHQP